MQLYMQEPNATNVIQESKTASINTHKRNLKNTSPEEKLIKSISILFTAHLQQ